MEQHAWNLARDLGISASVLQLIQGETADPEVRLILILGISCSWAVSHGENPHKILSAQIHLTFVNINMCLGY